MFRCYDGGMHSRPPHMHTQYRGNQGYKIISLTLEKCAPYLPNIYSKFDITPYSSSHSIQIIMHIGESKI